MASHLGPFWSSTERCAVVGRLRGMYLNAPPRIRVNYGVEAERWISPEVWGRHVIEDEVSRNISFRHVLCRDIRVSASKLIEYNYIPYQVFEQRQWESIVAKVPSTKWRRWSDSEVRRCRKLAWS